MYVDALSRNPVNIGIVDIGETDWFLTDQKEVVTALTTGIATWDVRHTYRIK